MPRSSRSVRGLVAAGLAVGLVVAACGSSSSSGNPFFPGGGGPTGGGGNGNGNGQALSQGLSANLDKLDSYQFTASMGSATAPRGASPGSSSAALITGTVINRGIKSIWINDLGVQFIVVGDKSWTSSDGKQWAEDTSGGTTVDSLLPGHDYATWFDANGSNFKAAGEETQNGVQCIHFKGDSSLGSLYSGVTGVSANFQADLWVARDGNYPVKGIYGFSTSSGGNSSGFGYSFDVTHVNDPSNKVEAPTNVLTIPTDPPSS